MNQSEDSSDTQNLPRVPTFEEVMNDPKYWENEEEFKKQNRKELLDLEKSLEIENYKMKKDQLNFFSNLFQQFLFFKFLIFFCINE